MKITGVQAAIEAERAVTQNPPILYEHEDCQRFVKNTIKRAGGDIPEYAGSNDMYRNACSEVLPLAIARLQPGMVLFIVEHDGGEPAQYKADGKGNASHIGWYTGGMYKVVHSSATRGQVASSTLKNGWTHAGYLKALQYNGAEEPIEPAVHGTAYINLPTTANVFHRISPSTGAGWYGRINGGEAVEIVSSSGEWTRVRYGGKDGYVMSKFITTNTAPQPDPMPPDVQVVRLTLEQEQKLNQAIILIQEVIGNG